MTKTNYEIINRLSEWAQDHGHALTELAIAWLMAQPQVASVISGATRLEHILQNAKAADWILSQNEVSEINQLLQI